MDTQSNSAEVHLTAENVENTDLEHLKEVPEKPKQLTRAEIGKLRRAYITVVHGIVKACGHKFDPKGQPRMSNCPWCWEAYFMVAVDTAAIHNDLMKGGKKALEAKFGKTFVKQFGQFLIEQMTKEMHENNSRPTNSDSGSTDQHTHSDQCDHGVRGEVPSGETQPIGG
jgi:hypothetical protein